MSAWLPALTMGIGREERQKEYLAAMERAVVEEKRKLRNDTVEECALVAEGLGAYAFILGERVDIAVAIRALKEKPL